jgi:hypothetical protein
MMQLKSSGRSIPTPTPAHLLADPRLLKDGDLAALHGFGGVHGGLMLALLAGHLSEDADRRPLRYVTGQFHRPTLGSPTLVTDDVAIGRSVARTAGRVVARDRNTLVASAVFGANPADGGPSTFTSMPTVPAHDDCEVFAIPTEFVPFAQFLEIRPADDHRPFAGGDEPTLTAWIRFVEDDKAPDALRLVTLLDALAPSYAAVLPEPVAIPTVELSVRISSGLDRATSPWILLRASTVHVDGDWLDERIDAWSPAGDHLAAATQVRLVRR